MMIKKKFILESNMWLLEEMYNLFLLDICEIWRKYFINNVIVKLIFSYHTENIKLCILYDNIIYFKYLGNLILDWDRVIRLMKLLIKYSSFLNMLLNILIFIILHILKC